MALLLFVAGGAGAGKTTLARALARRCRMALLDMDILLRPAAEAIMTGAGLDPSDRDSAEYKRLCRDLGYRITIDAALDQLSNGQDAVVIGPFTRELEDANWIEGELAKLGNGTFPQSPEQVEVKVILVYLPAAEQHYERILARGSKLDQWKLDHWDAFSSSLVRREVRWPLPEGAVLDWDNSEPLTEERLGLLERFARGDKKAGVAQ
ncbi:dephospho-CoA kinase [Paenibacillus cellulosilyticus]|uniref:Dephospho-CoA kinase n=1 Tax=Paenibacillus cellulosilyticus TaxID=375489 RepID=A0A2V2YQ59_9BACL|nr:AAA family ATPase [Paenibacillus cellulosilyticus]PWV98566.1 dephospho-CoA kinase [Paenibacillus cellulosilyticus]QKS44170.1 AAA family ATPase [Paenibacillus cellulosilyticus]